MITPRAKTKFETKIFTRSEDSIRYTIYATWFDEHIVVVFEKEIGDEDWEVKNHLSLPKKLMEIFNVKKVGSTVTNTAEAFQPSKNCEFREKTAVDRFESLMPVRTVLFQCDCDEMPLSEIQLGYLSDLETLECF